MKRTIIIGGREIVIGALGQPMDSMFDRLHAAYFGQVPLPWEEFEAAALDFFNRTAANWGEHDAYFNNFTVIWRLFLTRGGTSTQSTSGKARSNQLWSGSRRIPPPYSQRNALLLLEYDGTPARGPGPWLPSHSSGCARRY